MVSAEWVWNYTQEKCQGMNLISALFLLPFWFSFLGKYWSTYSSKRKDSSPRQRHCLGSDSNSQRPHLRKWFSVSCSFEFPTSIPSKQQSKWTSVILNHPTVCQASLGKKLYIYLWQQRRRSQLESEGSRRNRGPSIWTGWWKETCWYWCSFFSWVLGWCHLSTTISSRDQHFEYQFCSPSSDNMVDSTILRSIRQILAGPPLGELIGIDIWAENLGGCSDVIWSFGLYSLPTLSHRRSIFLRRLL